MKEPNAMSFHVKYKPEDFMPANEEEKQSQVIMRESVGFWQDGFRRLRKNKVAMVSLFVIIVVMIFSFIVPAFYPYDYKTQIKGSENLHPMQYSEKEIERMDAGEKVFPHVLGTDKMGRDYAIRVMMGSRISLLVGLIATAIIFVIGSLIGSISAFFGGWVDLIIMRIVDIFNCLPDLPLLLIVGAVLDALEVPATNRIYFMMTFLTFFGWTGTARIVRGQILSLREQEFMVSATARGLSTRRKIFRHLIPNIMPQLIVTMTLGLGSVILTESTLSYLNLGVPKPYAAWGSMISEIKDPVILQRYFNLWGPPGLCIVLAVLGFNFVGDGLRDAFDPKSRR